MDEVEIENLVDTLIQELDSEHEIPRVMLERLISLAFRKQFDSDRMSLVSDIKQILDNFGYRL